MGKNYSGGWIGFLLSPSWLKLYRHLLTTLSLLALPQTP
jgi:hypothetical protein